MNLTYQQGMQLLEEILKEKINLPVERQVIFAVPFPYLIMANSAVAGEDNYSVAAQNCSHKSSGAYTGEVSVDMLYSVGIRFCLVGHSERREYFQETNEMIREKVDLLLLQHMQPIFCCGESLSTREANGQNEFVEKQLRESLFHLSAEQIVKVIIAYEPIWAIGTGKTATTQQAQEMQSHIRTLLADQYGKDIANGLPILYGGSVKASNAKELFSSPDVDGGLVGGACLVAQEFIQIIKALK